MSKRVWRIGKVHAELFLVGVAFTAAVVGLIYFNWLIAVSRY